MEIRFWGTRGSVPTPGPQTVRFGGNTSCVEVRTESDHVFVFDCGTGARLLGDALVAHGPVSASMLISHTHWDHIQGFPFFAPAFTPNNTIAVYGPEGGRRSLHDTLAQQMEHSYFPVDLSQLPATLTYHDLGEGAHKLGGARVIAQYLNHPAVTLGYRLDTEHADAALCEWVIGEMDRTPPAVAAALHDCFESIDTRPLLSGIEIPVLLLSGDRSRIASEQQRAFVDRLPHGRLELFAGCGHGVNLLQPERCARASLDFWRTIDLPAEAGSAGDADAGTSKRGTGPGPD